MKKITGSCLCGSITFRAKTNAEAHGCHCQTCRRAGGAPFYAVSVQDFVLETGTEDLGLYASSKWGQRGFCKKCSCSLFYEAKNGAYRAVSLGAIDAPEPKLARHIYCDSAEVNPEHTPDIFDDLPQLTGRELLDSVGLHDKPAGEIPPIADMSQPHHDGGCLCGGVRFRTTNRLDSLLICHCGQCRKQASSYYRATETTREDFTLLKQDTLAWFRSSEEAERGFCHDCGSTLFWRKTSAGHGYRGENTGISILQGAFDERLPLKLEAHIFTEESTGAYPLPNKDK